MEAIWAAAVELMLHLVLQIRHAMAVVRAIIFGTSCQLHRTIFASKPVSAVAVVIIFPIRAASVDARTENKDK